MALIEGSHFALSGSSKTRAKFVDHAVPRRLEEFRDCCARKPAQMSAIQQSAILIPELTAVQSCLNAPVLSIWDTGDHSRIRVNVSPDARQHGPRVAEVFQGVGKDPAIGREKRREHGFIDLLDVLANYGTAERPRVISRFPVNFNAYILACRVGFAIRTGQSPSAATHLDDSLQIGRDSCRT
ncbi:MAG TPA: hypothetical protein VEN29_20130 [Casimicrobiaceae bacterium]|nr:hypothetical protein [Casimicrobiaceae bacterium]